MSHRRSVTPRNRSGAMNRNVPTNVVRLREVIPLHEFCQAEVGDPDVAPASSSRFEGLMSRCTTPLADGRSQGVGHLAGKPGDFPVIDRLGLAGERVAIGPAVGSGTGQDLTSTDSAVAAGRVSGPIGNRQGRGRL